MTTRLPDGNLQRPPICKTREPCATRAGFGLGNQLLSRRGTRKRTGAAIARHAKSKLTRPYCRGTAPAAPTRPRPPSPHLESRVARVFRQMVSVGRARSAGPLRQPLPP